MKVWLKEGGDPNFWWYNFRIHEYEVDDNFIEELRDEIMPRLVPLKIEFPLIRMPWILCSACGDPLPVKSTLEETLAQTHVHSSLILQDRTIYLLDLVCASKIKFYIEERHSDGKLVYPGEDCGQFK